MFQRQAGIVGLSKTMQQRVDLPDSSPGLEAEGFFWELVAWHEGSLGAGNGIFLSLATFLVG